jgi:hypothetical protein
MMGLQKFKKPRSHQSATFAGNRFSVKGKGDKVYLAKIGNVKPIWSRELPKIWVESPVILGGLLVSNCREFQIVLYNNIAIAFHS